MASPVWTGRWELLFTICCACSVSTIPAFAEDPPRDRLFARIYGCEAAGVAAATAEALKPDATVDGIVSACLSRLSDVPLREVQQTLNEADQTGDWKSLRPYLAEKYRGRPMSNAVEVLAGGLACFKLAKGRRPFEGLFGILEKRMDTPLHR
jgi:hypothetical protein